MKTPAILLVFTGCLIGCSGEEKTTDTKPTNLQLNVEVDDSGTGEVEVTASATNAAYFEITFDGPSSLVTSTNGKASYTYRSSGLYVIKVEAFAEDESSISTSKSVPVSVNAPVDIEGTGYSTPLTYDGYTLIWQDEFAGSSLDANAWTHEIGTGSNGWGNNELQYYRAENTSLKDGFLVITAKKEVFSASSYTSSRLITKGKKEFRYGRIDIRAQLPKGQGLWPALWMMGKNIESVGWPACGEIDIMEMIGGNGRENTVFGTLHWEEGGPRCTCDKPGYTLASGSFSDKFYVFSITWDETNVKWYVDDVLFNTIAITPASLSEFKEEFFFLFNVAVGGNWPGNPDNTTVFPQWMIVDYIRVFQKN